jgi:hypothetical protein
VEAFVISWTGFADSARTIAGSLSPLVDRVTVVYSNREGTTETGPGDWVQVPDAYFYSKKFETCLEHFTGEVMLQVQADASCDDWPALISALESAFERPTMGVWSPVVDFSGWPLDRVALTPMSESLTYVATTDSVVWGLSAQVCSRLHELDYDLDPFGYGYGIDIAASAIAFSRGGEVVMDSRVFVSHPHGTAYDRNAADAGSQFFLAQLSHAETRYLVLLQVIFKARNREESAVAEVRRLVSRLPGVRRAMRVVRRWIRAARARADGSTGS